MTDLPPAARPALSPREARTRFRAGTHVPTVGWAPGYAQANLIAVPADLADDLRRFTLANPRACPLLEITAPGSFATRLADEADLRTDLPAYRVWEWGECVAEVADATPFWRPDLVTFLLGCSFTFEAALLAAGVPVRHLEQGVNVPMYRTDRPCHPAGRLHGPLVVSMRPIPAPLVDRATAVTAEYPDMHGAPVHAGDPARLGIADLSRPDFGDPVAVAADEVPVFWACGVTSQAAVMASRPEFAITHAPGHMFITDRPDATFRVGPSRQESLHDVIS
jgi:uncharacterized protein YcsI (UPF0317 family)